VKAIHPASPVLRLIVAGGALAVALALGAAFVVVWFLTHAD
jgi:hypothetical protein